MVLQSHDILDFFNSSQGMNYPDLLLHAEQEATRAERLCLNRHASDVHDLESCRRYADFLKKLIFFFRYGIRPADVPENQYELIQELCNAVSRKQGASPRCGPADEGGVSGIKG